MRKIRSILGLDRTGKCKYELVCRRRSLETLLDQVLVQVNSKENLPG